MKKGRGRLIVSIAIAELVGIISGIFAGNAPAIYKNLMRPPLSPPAWAFPVVWVLLYGCMGVAAYLVSSSGAPIRQKRAVLRLYAAQLIVNALWAFVFFGAQGFRAGIAVILLLDILVVCCILAFDKIERKAALWMLPYLAWILFATYLNVWIAVLNS